jgi:hypothetical protein
MPQGPTGAGILQEFGDLVQVALPNTLILYQETSETAIPADQLVAPKSVTVIYLADETVENLEWRQVNKTWLIRGYIYQNRERDRLTCQDDLDAIGVAVFENNQLATGGQTVIRSNFFSSVVESHIDASRVIGTFDYTAEFWTPGRAQIVL